MPLNPTSPLQHLWTRLIRPIKSTIFIGLVVAIGSVFLPNYYKSEAKLLPVDAGTQGGMAGFAATAAALGVGMGVSATPDSNFLDILKSRWLLEQLVQTSFDYRMQYWRFGPNRQRRGTLFSYLEVVNMDQAVSALDGLLTTSKDLKSNVITISAETRSPELSQLVVGRAVELLNLFVIQNGRTHNSEKASYAEARLAEANIEVSRAEEAFRAFLESNRGYYQASTDPSVRLRGARLEADLNLRRQVLTTLAVSREQALLDAKNDVPIVNVLDKANLPLEKSKPRRSILVLFGSLLAGLGTALWQERGWVWKHLVESEGR